MFISTAQMFSDKSKLSKLLLHKLSEEFNLMNNAKIKSQKGYMSINTINKSYLNKFRSSDLAKLSNYTFKTALTPFAGVYVLINNNTKVYVGQSCKIYDRISDHRLRDNKTAYFQFDTVRLYLPTVSYSTLIKDLADNLDNVINYYRANNIHEWYSNTNKSESLLVLKEHLIRFNIDRLETFLINYYYSTCGYSNNNMNGNKLRSANSLNNPNKIGHNFYNLRMLINREFKIPNLLDASFKNFLEGIKVVDYDILSNSVRNRAIILSPGQIKYVLNHTKNYPRFKA